MPRTKASDKFPTEAEQAAWWAGYSASEQAVERLIERIEQLERVQKAAKAVLDFEYPKIGSERRHVSRNGQAVWIHLRRALKIAEVSPE